MRVYNFNMYVLKAPDRSNVSEKNLSSVRENRTEETTRLIITPKRHLSQVKVCVILQDYEYFFIYIYLFNNK